MADLTLKFHGSRNVQPGATLTIQLGGQTRNYKVVLVRRIELKRENLPDIVETEIELNVV